MDRYKFFGLTNEEKKKYCKRMSEIFSHYYDPLALWMSKLIVKYTSIMPNTISLLGLIAAVISAAFLGVSGYTDDPYKYRLIGAVVAFIYYNIDHFDGKTARLRGIASSFGKWLDLMIGYICISLMFAGFAIGLRSNLAIGLLALILFSYIYAAFLIQMYKANFEQLVSQKKIELVKDRWYRWWYGMSLMSPVMLVATIANRPYYFLYFFALFATLYWMSILFLQRKTMMKYEKEGKK